MSAPTFSQEVRSHLAQVENDRPCCQKALLLALLSVCASEAAEGQLIVSLENGGVARLLFKLAKQALGVTPHLHDPDPSQRGTHYRLVLPIPAEGLGGVMSLDDLQRTIRRRACCRRAFLRGAFLGCGSIVNPERAYHLEFTATGELSSWIVVLLQDEGVKAGHYRRSGHAHWTAYVKKSEDIATFLTLVGAVPALLALEELLISRDLKNNVQRAVNCETANLDRTVSTAQEQIARIETLENTGRLKALPPELVETAELRRENPFASLAQLAELHSPPLSKSAINHRLRKIAQLADGGDASTTH
ncbi:DNA-binding protein WhiA [bacterium]|nr:DNA-binding protein WhiA [bacterium]